MVPAVERGVFPCKEPGCDKMIRAEPQNSVEIKTGCASTNIVYKCPGCGRLYWSSGAAVLSRAYEKAFFGQENKPLLAVEKAAVIRPIIKDAAGARRTADVNYFVTELMVIVRSGHAADCPASASSSPCSCGVEDAYKFVKEHPPSSDVGK